MLGGWRNVIRDGLASLGDYTVTLINLVLLLPGHVVLDRVGVPRPCSCVADLRS